MKKIGQSDFTLALCVVTLIILGVIMVFSASYYGTISQNNGPYAYLIRSALWSACGIVLLIGLYFLPYRFYYYIAPAALVVGLILLILLYTPLGVERGGATRWLEIGPITLMPGEIIKICAIIFVARYCTNKKDGIRLLKRGYLPVFGLAISCFFLIFGQPNLSTAFIVFLIIMVMVYLAGANFKHLAITFLVGVSGVAAILLLNPDNYHLKRIAGYWNPFDDAQGDFYQLVQSLLAFGSGGVFGVGPGHSVQKALYLPEAQNDFIFAIIGEEFGFLGCIAIIMVFLVLIWRCTLVSMNAPDRFGMLVGSGITVMLALQVIFNIGVVTGLLPPTGVTLPFISYGGNAMLLFSGSMGIILNISRETAKIAVPEASAGKAKKKKRFIVREKTEKVSKERKNEAV